VSCLQVFTDSSYSQLPVLIIVIIYLYDKCVEYFISIVVLTDTVTHICQILTDFLNSLAIALSTKFTIVTAGVHVN